MDTLAANITTLNQQIRANLTVVTQDVILGKKRHQPAAVEGGTLEVV